MTSLQHIHQDEDNDSNNQDHFNHSDHDHNTSQHFLKQTHGLLLTISYFALLQLGIWSHQFRHWRWSLLVHITCMSLITLLSVIAVVIMLTAQGKAVIWESLYHQTIGFFVVAGLLPITVIKGGIARVLMGWYRVDTPWVVMMKQGHRGFGWVVVGLVQVPMLTGWAEDGIGICVIIGLIDVISYGLYWYLKLTKKKLSQTLIPQNPHPPPHSHPVPTYPSLPTFTSPSNPNPHHNTTFIFSNSIYSLQPLQNCHPGGQMLIQLIRNKEVDRYLYGMCMVEKYEKGRVERYQHCGDCLALAGVVVGRVGIGEVDGRLGEVNLCGVGEMECNSNQSMYILYLKLKSPPTQTLQLQPIPKTPSSYTSLTQLGRYRAINIQNTTRLYSNVQFLRPSNIKKMKSIMQGTWHEKYRKVEKDNSRNDGSDGEGKIQMEEKLMNWGDGDGDGGDRFQWIPVFVKKYEMGKFTAKLKESVLRGVPVLLSQSRGFGLGLDYDYDYQIVQRKGKQQLVLIAGGTGLNPFCDMIDLLYKQLLTDQYPNNFYPTLQSPSSLSLSTLYKIHLYIALDSLSYIHPITLFQCQQLCKHNVIQCWMKIKYRNSMTGSGLGNSGVGMGMSGMSQSRGIQFLQLTYRFQAIVEKELGVDPDARFIVCGPTQMTQPVLGSLEKNGVAANRYRIL